MLTCGEDAHQGLRRCLQAVDTPRVDPDKEAGQGSPRQGKGRAAAQDSAEAMGTAQAAHRWRDDDKYAVARNKRQPLAAAGSVGDER